jgi:DNA-binding transcriptional MocR family regulator
MTAKSKHFVMISNDMVRSGKIPPHELVVYLNLKSRKGNKQSAWPSHSRIAKETAMSVSKVKLCIRHLQALGYIRVSPQFAGPGKQTSNLYHIFDTPSSRAKTTPGARRDYKEDSLEEDSNTNSPKETLGVSKSKWRHLKDGKPATEKQLAFLRGLLQESGLDEDDFYRYKSERLDELDQVQAAFYIRELWVEKFREDLYG